MKSLKLLVGVFFLAVLLFSSCGKEDFAQEKVDNQPSTIQNEVSKRRSIKTSAAPNIIIESYDENYCCNIASYTLNDLTYSYYSPNYDFIFIFDAGTANEYSRVTSDQVLYKGWPSDGTHSVIVKLYNPATGTVGSSASDVYTYDHLEKLPQNVCPSCL